jgi:hypothetical protein
MIPVAKDASLERLAHDESQRPYESEQETADLDECYGLKGGNRGLRGWKRLLVGKRGVRRSGRSVHKDPGERIGR